jgi:hypothetical protein
MVEAFKYLNNDNFQVLDSLNSMKPASLGSVYNNRNFEKRALPWKAYLP